MDILIGWQPYETTFKGQTVTMELLPLTVPLFRLILPHMKNIEDKDEAAQNAMEMISKSLGVFQGHVRNVQCFTVNGQPVTPEMLIGEAKLIRLAQDIVNEVFLRSMVTAEEGKNSGSPSETLSLDDHPLSVSEE